MSVVTNSSPVEAGHDALAEQYNDLRLDLLAVEANSPIIGAILFYAGSSASLPDGWHVCDGAALNRTTYATLFARLAEIWGEGDGTSTFNIPDLRGKFIAGAGGDIDLAESGGSDTVDTTHHHVGGSHLHAIPSHVHPGPAHTHYIAPHAHSAGSYFAMWEMVYDTGGGNYYNKVSAGFTANTRGASYSSSNSVSSGRGTGIQVGGTSANGGEANTGSSGTADTGAWSGNTGNGGNVDTSDAGLATQENRPSFKGLFYIIKIS